MLTMGITMNVCSDSPEELQVHQKSLKGLEAK